MVVSFADHAYPLPCLNKDARTGGATIERGATPPKVKPCLLKAHRTHAKDEIYVAQSRLVK
jgi:hypothetical protein